MAKCYKFIFSFLMLGTSFLAGTIFAAGPLFGTTSVTITGGSITIHKPGLYGIKAGENVKIVRAEQLRQHTVNIDVESK